MGREATLNYPSIDNQFRNDTKSGVLIRTFYDNGSITVSLYGDKEGRRCTAEGPNILQTIPILAVAPDGATLASASWDGAVRLWPLYAGLVSR